MPNIISRNGSTTPISGHYFIDANNDSAPTGTVAASTHPWLNVQN